MYSWEIEQLIKLKNYIISAQDYSKIITTSPQIHSIEYKPFEDSFYIWTDDRYILRFKVEKENK